MANFAIDAQMTCSLAADAIKFAFDDFFSFCAPTAVFQCQTMQLEISWCANKDLHKSDQYAFNFIADLNARGLDLHCHPRKLTNPQTSQRYSDIILNLVDEWLS